MPGRQNRDSSDGATTGQPSQVQILGQDMIAEMFGQMSTMMQQTIQCHVVPALDRMMVEQATMASRLERLEQEPGRSATSPQGVVGDVASQMETLNLSSQDAVNLDAQSRNSGGDKVDIAKPTIHRMGDASAAEGSRRAERGQVVDPSTSNLPAVQPVPEGPAIAPQFLAGGFTEVGGVRYAWRVTQEGD